MGATPANDVNLHDVEARGEAGVGLLHHDADVVMISGVKLGALVNTVARCYQAPR